MSITAFTRVLHTYDAKTRVLLLEHLTDWISDKDNVASVTKIKHRVIKKHKRKQIPKMIRGKVWERYHGTSLKGACYCCKRELHAFDAWHVGHIKSHANGGSDMPSNLRPVCASCNTSMGTQNMDEFKAQYDAE
jgi:5-methylcytosine-specific restriction endonuclease McrA